MIVSRAVGCFLVWLVFVGQTSAFLQDKCMGLDPIQVVQSAKFINSLLQEYPALVKKAPSLFKAAGKVAEQGLAVIKANANPALFGVSIYFGGILVTAYYLTNDANKQLLKAHFHLEELDMIIETEILPVLEFFDTAIEREGVHSKKIKGFCSPRFENFDEAINYLRRERKKIEKKLIESTTGETRSNVLKYLNGGVGVSSTIWTAATCFAAGPACPWIAGSSMVISSGIGYYLFGESQSTYRQSFEVLVLAREKAFNTEKMLRHLKTKINIGCWDLKTHDCIKLLE